MFQLRQLRKTWDENFRIEIDELDVQHGEAFVLVGPTGSGKTTLLRLLALVVPATKGEIRFDRKPARADDMDPTQRRRITMVFQRPALLSATVFHNVAYGLHIRGEKECIQPRVDRLLDRFGIAHLASADAHTLSVGQMQLVALARALAVEPDVLLLDEPTANLDPSRVALVEEIILDDHRERGTTVIWSTHNLFQARRVADRVGFLLDGRLVECSATEDFFEAPKNPRTDDFVRGKMVY